MTKENMNIQQKLEKILTKPADFKDLMVAMTIFGLFLYGVDAVYDSQNLLTDAKTNKQSPPGEVCVDSEGILGKDMGCWSQEVGELCDGQNTIFDRSDDVCETIEYWNYRPVVAR